MATYTRSGNLITSAQEVEDLAKARYPIIWVVSAEEERVEKELLKMAQRREMRLLAWSITKGFESLTGGSGAKDVKDPMKALEDLIKADGKVLFVLRDFHPFLRDPQVVRKTRDVARQFRESQKTLVILSAVQNIPPEIEKDIAVVDWDLPNRKDLEDIVDDLLAGLPAGAQPGPAADSTGRERLVEAALGLTYLEAQNVYAKSIVRERTFDIDTILSEKKHIIRKSGILEYYEAQEDINEIGGLDVLKEWLQKRSHAFTSKAREFGVPLPKGLLLIGVPGCGKSLTAKAVGTLWQMPLLRLDVGRIFSGLVGSSEENIRKAIKVSESIAPCVMWLDEIEKGFSGTGSSNFSDAGTTSRVFGSFVTWMQEKQVPVFVIATANDVRSLPPELLRKGRFDEIFFVDLPTPEERKAILEIHLRKKRRDPAGFDLDGILKLTEEFSGAELEQAVVSALYDAFDARVQDGVSELDTPRMGVACKEIVPLSITMKEGIDFMREWAATRARPASTTQARKLAKAKEPVPARKLEI